MAASSTSDMPTTVVRPITKLLIANRGEIAVRVTRACRELGIRSVLACSEVDANSLAARVADEFVILGPAVASASYLSISAVIKAAKNSEADAVHPGYGFLSERAAFAKACEDAGLNFVGPPAHVIAALGDKIEARKTMSAAGVPVTPGYHGDDQSETALFKAAEDIGTPLLIKAAGGGGGRGMRIVRELPLFAEMLQEARTEAKAAFSDDRVLLERYVENARHVEFQMFGDYYGNVIHLYERDCSIQRRHQKIIEESPCPVLLPETRQKMSDATVLAGKTAGYVNAGTVEFLLEEHSDGGQSFYFLEVNTRLQVEHPVTEMVTGLDLVHLQLRVAAGQPLPYRQDRIGVRGCSIETRIYAEDPSRNFMPSVGPLTNWRQPSGPGIRVDAGFETGDIVSPYYDPMLAKLIVFGEDREIAVQRLISALEDFAVQGIDCNIPYLLSIAHNSVFANGQANTGFLAKELPDWKPDSRLPEEVLLALAAVSAQPPRNTGRGKNPSSSTNGNSNANSLWHSGGNWRNC